MNTVDCIWSSYGEWTECSKTCGWGLKTAKRKIAQPALYGGKECTGTALSTEKCKLQSCSGRKTFDYTRLLCVYI